MARPIQIAPSVLPADFARLGEEVVALEKAGVDLIQWDVMDGQFVPNLTFGPDVIAAARSWVDLPFEAHLMVLTPGRDGAPLRRGRVPPPDRPRRGVHRTSTARCRRSASSAPAPAWRSTRPRPPSAVAHVLDLVELVLVMTVNPGWGGQPYLATMEPKIAEVRRMVDAAGLADAIDVEVDGGIGPDTVAAAAAAGANVLVAGSALYQDPEGLEHAVTRPAPAGGRGDVT